MENKNVNQERTRGETIKFYWKQNRPEEIIKIYQNVRVLRILVENPKTKSTVLTKIYKMKGEQTQCLTKLQELINEGFELKEVFYR